ncbi:F0F1 ATP synthase subunit epsilon [Myceligenerans xiligouense]|uniref:ATP synthase epsilon chain n=1 Tax=Myceligenerans xiligouense TaxID=253184 RepID=A0A3N4Z4P2_9MICO|nr:F0F1 ATP synthase subunit epsilon [Myceligenerans xiligouense]RPF20172.1 ATP synthase F1 subcomplex epsilon subunit [Myceligenerans xiligouense]
MVELNVDLVATDRKVWSGRARTVVAPSVEGEIGILADHQPLLAVLRPGKVTVRTDEGVAVEAQVDGGFVSVDENLVTIVVDEIEQV